jgi:hypothetical protein
VAVFTDTTDAPLVELTDLAVTEIGRKDLGVVAFRYAGFAVGREGYNDSNPVKVDAIVSADTALREQMYPLPYGDDVVLVGHMNKTTPDLTYLRDGGSLTGTPSGSPAMTAVNFKFGPRALEISGGSHEHVDYSGAGLIDGLVDTGCVSLWYRPGYTGSPAATQHILATGASTSDDSDGLKLFHSSGGTLTASVRSYTGAAIANVTWAFSPTSGTYYHIELDWDTLDGATRLFVDGDQKSTTQTDTGTRGATAQALRLGESISASTLINTFTVDELIMYDQVQHVADFDVPTAQADPLRLLDFAAYEPGDLNTVNLTCRLAHDQGLWGLGELGIWAEITMDSVTPSRVGEKFLFAIAHFPFVGKTSREVDVWQFAMKG